MKYKTIKIRKDLCGGSFDTLHFEWSVESIENSTAKTPRAKWVKHATGVDLYGQQLRSAIITITDTPENVDRLASEIDRADNYWDVESLLSTHTRAIEEGRY